ncbi:DUF1127 domain-containing protein [Pseudomonas borbori]|uniref:Uncharacterized conserved protein YjiS, DUF1127 family n=1 Tax=Pseudomonas borbori TaxID=289003 RepID=A0A1I5PRC3_9PSED|nr:DUF1127 domain-containing protein [Pseudomonas borbori]SFP36564.1 Uncharacterized conserved protein YjiS, DUF1127 family [Pseudomonas borbori]
MNGLSDTRLTLRQRELLIDGQPRLVDARPQASAPEASRWQRWWRRLSTRRALLELDAAQLKDVGITREQALAEVLRPFWKL